MKVKSDIFNKTFLCTLGVVGLLLVPNLSFAAINTGCDDNSGNEYINPELALCSTHVYNIGGVQNPDNDAQKATMKDAVALKTTVMTQQMYKQYEYLESMMKRFKTQLEKAVLTTKLQAAGAGTDGNSSTSSSSSSSGSRSTDTYAVLSDARNCNNETGGTLAVYECLQSNISAVLSALDNNKMSDAKRQLESDLKIAERWLGSKPTKCTSSLSGTPRIRECAYELSKTITTAKEDYELKRMHKQI